MADYCSVLRVARVQHPAADPAVFGCPHQTVSGAHDSRSGGRSRRSTPAPWMLRPLLPWWQGATLTSQ
jgi:hypothetical protein